MRFGAALTLITFVAGVALAWQGWRAGDFVSLWLTPDQRARLAYEKLEFPEAFELFEDPAWKGVAAYDSGLYSESAAAFGRMPTAEGFFNRGNAFMKGREYGKAIVATSRPLRKRRIGQRRRKTSSLPPTRWNTSRAHANNRTRVTKAN